MAVVGVRVDDAGLAAQVESALARHGHVLLPGAGGGRLADAAAAPPALMVVDAASLQADATEPVPPAQGRQAQTTPCIVLGDAHSLAHRRLAARCGAARFLSLPLDAQSLAAAIASLVDDGGGRPVGVMLAGPIGPETEQRLHALTRSGCSVHYETDAARLFQAMRMHEVDVLVLLAGIGGATVPELLRWLDQDALFDDVARIVVLRGAPQQLPLPAGTDSLFEPLPAATLVDAVHGAARRRRRRAAGATQVQHLMTVQAHTRRALDAHALVSITDQRGCIVQVNDHFVRTSGYTREELLGQNHRIVKSDRHPPERYAELWRTISGGDIWQGELCNRRKDGSLYWVSTTIVPMPAAHGRSRRYVSIRTDISAVKQVQQALRQRVRQQQLLNGLASRLMLCNLADVLAQMPALLRLSARLLGADRAQCFVCEPGALAPQPVGVWPPAGPAWAADAVAALWASWQGHDVVKLHDAAARVPEVAPGLDVNGLPGLRSLLLVPLRDAGGAQGFLAYETQTRPRSWTYRDLSFAKALAHLLATACARARAEDSLVQARDEANRANRAKSDFLATMSHELRTPMNAILGFGQLLELDADRRSRQWDYVQQLLGAGRHLLTLIDDVLNLARIDSGRLELSLERVALGEVIEDCLRLVRPLAQQRHVGMHLQLPHGLALKADRTRLRQVLINLLTNAIKYNVDGGRIDIRADRVTASRVRLGVRDTGAGIPAERRHELFQPFNRLGAEGGAVEGTGIGLAIVRRLVGLMNGEVGLDSVSGPGSLFWIELPAFEEGDAVGAEPVAESRWEALPDLTGKRLLYIDDNPSNLRLVSRMMARWPSVTLMTAQDPLVGLDLAAARQPDVILLDIQMSPIDGCEVLSRLRSQAALAATPVIAITANAMPRDLDRVRAAGFDDLITKPFDLRRLTATLERFFGQTQAASAAGVGGSRSSMHASNCATCSGLVR